MANPTDDIDALIERAERNAPQVATKRATNGSGQLIPTLGEATPSGPNSLLARWLALKAALKEAIALGLKVRIAGAGVLFHCLEALPEALRRHLEAERELLWCYLGAEDTDLEVLDFTDRLGVAITLVETVAAARAAIRQLIGDLRRFGGPIAIDLETAPRPGMGALLPWHAIKVDGGNAERQPKVTDRAGLSPHLATIQTLQLYCGGATCFVFRHAARDLVLHSHWLRRQRLVAHHAGFDLGFIRNGTQDYRPPPGRRSRFRLDCSMQATGLLLGVEFGGGRSLAAAAKAFLDLEPPKALQISDWAAPVLSEGQIAYACADVIMVWRLWPALVHRLRETARWPAYELQRSAIPAVSDMERRGLGLDLAEHRAQSDAWALELAEARRTYQALTGQPPPTTPAQVQAWLATVLDAAALERWPRTRETEQLSIKDAHLKRLIHIPSCRPVLAMLAMSKLLSTFGPKLAGQLNAATGRLHANFSISGAKSGRFSCSHPNLQQLPSARAPAFKQCVIAAPGNVLVGCDWNQIEVRAAAWLSGDTALTQLYAEDRDLHAENAAMLAGVALADVTKDMRQAAKAVTFGSLFGMQARGLVEYAFDAYGIEIGLLDAEQALQRFFRSYPQLDKWRWDNWHECQRRQAVRIGAGREVEAAWEFGGTLRFTQCCNLPIQGICADAMLRALKLVHARLLAAAIRGGLVASVHDEILLEVHEHDAAAACEILQQAMIDAFVTTFPGAPTRGAATAKTGRTWAEVKA
jgi:DNA polymerase I-like protein with 3'-5' exonuclease and polymerase domains